VQNKNYIKKRKKVWLNALQKAIKQQRFLHVLNFMLFNTHIYKGPSYLFNVFNPVPFFGVYIYMWKCQKFRLSSSDAHASGVIEVIYSGYWRSPRKCLLHGLWCGQIPGIVDGNEFIDFGVFLCCLK
jgi:hypothetical protein